MFTYYSKHVIDVACCNVLVWWDYFFNFKVFACLFTGLNITDPPEDNIIVCVGDEVNITCGYTLTLSFKLSLTWIIDGVSYSSSEIMSSSIYHSPVVSNSEDTILTIYSVSEQMNGTTIQCEIPISPPVYSSNGTLTVIGKIQ